MTDPTRNEQVAASHRAGLFCEQIAAIHGISRNRVYQLCQKQWMRDYQTAMAVEGIVVQISGRGMGGWGNYEVQRTVFWRTKKQRTARHA